MIIYESTSDNQHIILQQTDEGLMLILDGIGQFKEQMEHRYHESLAVMPMLYGPSRRIFIGGGGDGLAATRLLWFDEVEQIVLCDYDAGVTELATSHPEMRRLNHDSMRDPRVTVLNADARSVLADSDEKYDLIICDFPDAFHSPLARLYSVEFYALCRSRLAEGGRIIIQTRSTPAIAPTVRATLAEVFPHTSFHRTFATCGFTMGAEQPLVPFREVPEQARFMTRAYAEASRALPREESLPLLPVHGHVIHDGGLDLVYDALSEQFASQVVALDRYNPSWYMMLLELERPAWITEEHLALLLRALTRHTGTVAIVADSVSARYAPLLQELGALPTSERQVYALSLDAQTAARLEILWARLNDGSVPQLSIHEIVPSAYTGVKDFIEGWLIEHSPALFTAPDSSISLDEVVDVAIAYDPNNGISSLFQGSSEDDIYRVEIAILSGNAQRDVLALILLAEELAKQGASVIEFLTIEPVQVRALEMLGAIRGDRYRAYAVPARA